MASIQPTNNGIMASRGATNSIHNLQTVPQRLQSQSGGNNGEAADVERMQSGMGGKVESMRAPETNKGTIVDVVG
ncbi:MAG: hypothetical protein JXR97_08645 [Planctomycetes bacterium]|nr:hypothetical protein [Planctomycetota bacterium]